MLSLIQLFVPVAILSSIVLGSDSSRIFGGQAASRGQFPYQVSLRKYESKLGFVNFCGGSIISDRFVLTAAYCNRELNTNSTATDYRVVVGAHVRNGDDGVTYKLKRWILHENYYRNASRPAGFIRNDIALIETTQPIKFTKLIAPIELQRNFIDGEIKALASGWGFTNGRNEVEQLKFLDVVTLTNPICREIFRLDGVIKKPPVHDWDTICTATQWEDHGTCDGDYGGPLVARNKLIGIASWSGCGTALPDIFTRVSTFIGWISRKTQLSF